MIMTAAGFYASKIRLVEDISKVIPNDNTVSEINLLLKNSKFLDKIIFNIRINDSLNEPDTDLLIEYSNNLIDSIESKFIPEYIKEINSKVDNEIMLGIYDIFYENLPVFLDNKDYEKISALITNDSIDNAMENNYKMLVSPASFVFKKFIKKDPLSITPVALKKLQKLQFSDNFEIYNNYIITKDHNNIIILVTPSHPDKTNKNNKLVEELDELINQLTNKYKQKIDADYFGTAVVAAGNAKRIKKDITITVSIALIVLLLFISIFFKRKRIVLIIILPVIFGGLISIAMLFLIKTEVSAMSLGIGSVLLGISVDFALHILAHYRRHGSVESVIKDLSTPIMMSSVTTASAFLCLNYVSSEALNDLGLFAAISVISAALFTLIALPHFLAKGQNSTKKKSLITNKTIIDKIASYNFHNNKILITVILILSVVFIYMSRRVSFESDMMKHNYMSEKLMNSEKRLNEITNVSQKTIYLISSGKDLNEALEKSENILWKVDSLEKIQVIKGVVSPVQILSSVRNQQKSIDIWNNFWTPEKKKIVLNKLKESGKRYGFKETAFSDFSDLLNKEFKLVDIKQLELLQKLFLDDYIIETENNATVISLLMVERNGIDENIVYKVFDNEEDGIWLFDKQLLTSKFVDMLKNNFYKLVSISLLVVFLILFVSFGRIELAIITFLPMILSWVWAIGIMGIFGIKFNIFNIIISTFIFGLGIDYSIFIMQGLLLNYKYGYKDITSYKISIILSAITTVVGIGVLIFAKHPALKSIAILSIIGIVSVIINAFTIQPILFKFLIKYKKGYRQIPITLSNFIISLFTLIIFIFGAITLTLIIPLFIIFPAHKKNKKLIYHYLLKYFAKFIVGINIFSKKQIINGTKEDFNKPAVIIANHQSHLDLMLIMMLHPRILILTNDWVWNNIFYGFVVKYADFFPFTQGYDVAVKRLKSKVKEGYSILIFPEGTRSETGKIKRFHKGAFLLAEKLNLDILPIILHGVNDCMKKGEIFLKKGSVSLKIMKRIKPDETQFGDNYSQKAKGLVKYFRKEFTKLKEEQETPDYFKNLIIKNYTYKGPVLEWYLKVKIRLEKNYRFFNKIIPRKCNIVDIGCGYGFLSYMLGLTSENRKITGIDYDKDKILIANNCTIKNKNIQFIHADIIEYEFDNSDIFILNDILHYMPEDLQIKTIERCFEKLNNNGLIIIRDANTDLNKRHIGTKLTEFFSTKSGFNKTNYDNLSFISKGLIENVVSKHKMNMEIIDNTTFTSNLIYIIRK